MNLEDLREYRRKKFKVECSWEKDGSFESGEKILKISHTTNGFQWHSLSLYEDEIPEFLSQINATVLKLGKPKAAAKEEKEDE